MTAKPGMALCQSLLKAAAIGALQGAAAGMTLVHKGRGVQIGQAHGPVTVGAAAAPRRRKG